MEAVSEIPELLIQFSPGNKELVSLGKAPGVRGVDQDRGHATFELHHEIEIQDGGAVYDVDNIRIITPKAHNIITDQNKGKRKS